MRGVIRQKPNYAPRVGGESRTMISTCAKCGGLFSFGALYETIGGIPCRCTSPTFLTNFQPIAATDNTETLRNALAENERLRAELEAAKREIAQAYQRGRDDQHRQLADAMYPRGSSHD